MYKSNNLLYIFQQASTAHSYLPTNAFRPRKSTVVKSLPTIIHKYRVTRRNYIDILKGSSSGAIGKAHSAISSQLYSRNLRNNGILGIRYSVIGSNDIITASIFYDYCGIARTITDLLYLIGTLPVSTADTYHTE